MRDPLRNIEDFVREKLSFLDNSYPNDWAAFERKLQRALFFRRLKILTSFVVLTAVLLITHQGLIDPVSPQYKTQNQPDHMAVSPTELPRLYSAQAPARQALKNNNNTLNSASAERRPARALAASQASQAHIPQQRPEKNQAPMAALETRPAIALISSLSGRQLNLTGLNYARSNGNVDLAAKADFQNDPQKLNIEDYFLDIRSPDYEVKPQKDKGPYISPLQPTNPWSYTINVYPNFTFRSFRVDPDKESLLHSDFIHEMQNNQKSGFSLNIGFEISKRIGPVTYLNSGIEYITNTYNADFNFTNFRDANVDPVSGEITGYDWRAETEQIIFADENQYHYLNFPLSISYQPWANEHVRLNIEAGASYLHFLTANGTTIDYKTLEVIDLSSQDYRQSMASLCFKLGAQYYVTPRINIGFEPALMYFTNTIYTKEYPFYVIPYSVGLNFNVQVKLN